MSPFNTTPAMDIQAVESKLTDVTVSTISRQKAHNRNQQREEQPQIQISAVNHSSGKTHQARSRNNADERDAGRANSLPTANNNFNNASANTNAQISIALAAYQCVRQLQAQLALLQQHASNSIALNPSSAKAMGGSMGPYINQNFVQNPVALQHCHTQSSSPIVVTTQTSGNITTPMTSVANLPSIAAIAANGCLSKYAQLLAVIEEIGRDLRPASIGSRGSAERLKRSIIHARVLVRECIMEIERAGLD
uniref:Cyclin-dependent kinase 2-associated protein n=1 Tax=Glossina austeni TaxID=7395 RepID=A0A1A9UJ45_GLOAU